MTLHCAWYTVPGLQGAQSMKQTLLPDWLVVTFTMLAIVTMFVLVVLLTDNL